MERKRIEEEEEEEEERKRNNEATVSDRSGGYKLAAKKQLACAPCGRKRGQEREESK